MIRSHKIHQLIFTLYAGIAINQQVYAEEYLPINQYIGNSKINVEVAKIRVSTEHNGLIADGKSQLKFKVILMAKDGSVIENGSATVIASNGLILDASNKPILNKPLILSVKNGFAEFTLVSPAEPCEVKVVVTSGTEKAEGSLIYAPEARDMVASGLIEGIISKRSIKIGSIKPTYFNDGFEQEIQHWSKSLGNNVSAAGRVAFFLKGKISGDALLTAAYDSDKDTRLKLAKSIDPNAVYPIYGDNSIVGFEAQSNSRLFVRIDKDKDYLLFGEFNTTGMSSAVSPVSMETTTAVNNTLLGRYNRTETGLKGHYENAKISADGFVINDSLTQVVEEYPTNGTSGPFAVKNNNAIQNSERVEVIVRDKNQHGIIKEVSPLVRYVDYSFEPFSGRILLTHALPTLTPSGDPISLRIMYEVDNGGERFLTYGASTNFSLGKNLNLGLSDVEDENPLSPYSLRSANADIAINEQLRIVLETAQTDSMQYTANGNLYSQPSSLSGEVGSNITGNATRVESVFTDKTKSAHIWWLKSDQGFNNPNSGVAPGREDIGAKGAIKLNDKIETFAEVSKSDDMIAQASRHAGQIGVRDNVTDRFKLELSLRKIHDNSGFPSNTAIAPNTAPLGSGTSVTGGFSGTGTLNTVIDPLTGNSINTLAPVGIGNNVANGINLDATTVRLGATWLATEKVEVNGEVETSIDGGNQHRAEIGSIYSLTDKEKIYARAETQTGLASTNSLNAAEHSNSFVAGMTHSISDETNIFSEYRVVNANSQNSPSSYDQMLANGLRDVHQIKDGLTATSTAEYLKIFSGNQRQALALTSGLDYTANPIWKAAEKLEYRKLFDDKSLTGNQTQDQWLSTISFARKLDANWTLLIKNYLLFQNNRDDASGIKIGNSYQERLLTGFAWRPADNNKVNGLMRYEYKKVNDQSQALGDRYYAHIASASMDYHPKRDWWATGRVAAKSVTDYNLPSESQSFNAWLLAGRLTYDLTEKVDVGVMASTLRQSSGSANQYAFGIEGGYQVKKNMWVSVGYNWSGFYDKDLSSSDYTERGIYIRLRAKFDELSF